MRRAGWVVKQTSDAESYDFCPLPADVDSNTKLGRHLTDYVIMGSVPDVRISDVEGGFSLFSDRFG